MLESIRPRQTLLRVADCPALTRRIVAAATAPASYLAAALTLLVVGAGYLQLKHGTPIVDDAYISLIYARNLADGSGLVFSDGARVEGYTNFLWVVLGALAYRTGIDPVLAVQVGGLALAGALVGAVWLWSSRKSEAPAALRFAPLILAASAPLAFWSLGGLESAASATLLFAGTCIAAYAGDRRSAAASGLLFFVAALAHPDAVVWAVIAGGFLSFMGARDKGRPGRALAFALAFGAPFAAYWVWRALYFDALMPNTFYAKGDFSLYQLKQGAMYVAGASPLIGAAASGLIAFAFVAGLHRRTDMRLFAAQVCGWTAYVVFVGGDSLLAQRFLLPVLAPAAVLLQESVAWLAARRDEHIDAPAGIALTGVLCAVTLAATLFGPETQKIRNEGAVDASRIELGRWLKSRTAESDVIAVNAAGAIPYFSERPAIDMMGLNDAHIARHGQTQMRAPAGHKRHDAAYVLDQTPAFIVLSPLVEQGQDIAAATASLPSVSALLGDERFWREYQRVRISDLATHEVVFARNDRAEALGRDGYATIVQPRSAP